MYELALCLLQHKWHVVKIKVYCIYYLVASFFSFTLEKHLSRDFVVHHSDNAKVASLSQFYIVLL